MILRRSRWERLLPIFAALICGAVFVTPAAAVTSISQGYTTTEAIAVGSLVSLQKDSTDTVMPSSTENTDSIIGVTINNGSSLLTLNNGDKVQAQVAMSGVVPALVSDCNGAISQGDQITASPMKGVGMKATVNAKVVGIAQGSMTNTTKITAEGAICNDTTVTLGQVPVLVNVSYHYNQPEKTLIPASLQNLANTVAGKRVSSLPIIIGAVIFLITIIIVASIIYSMIRSSIISVGRNPMAQSAVYRDVIQLSALVLGILGVAIIAIYLVLTRM